LPERAVDDDLDRAALDAMLVGRRDPVGGRAVGETVREQLRVPRVFAHAHVHRRLRQFERV
jgi:hypothetical protein